MYPSDSDEILCYVFSSFKGFIDTRVRAANLLLKEDLQIVESIVKNLIISKNSDDRDTALQVLIEINTEESKKEVLSLLDDDYPNIVFDTIEFIGKRYTSLVRRALYRLETHSEDWVRKKAKDLFLVYE